MASTVKKLSALNNESDSKKSTTVTPSKDSEIVWLDSSDNAIEFLRKDPVMNSLIQKYGKLSLTNSCDYFDDLISAIIGQLLSNKAADTIYKRIAKLCTADTLPQSSRLIKSTAISRYSTGGITPNSILAVPDEHLRAAGSSYGKIRCMKSLAEAVLNKTIDLDNVKNYDNDVIINQLTVIKGIGRWTAEMFLIFSLAREDVFSFGDGGLKNAINNLYSNDNPLTNLQIKQISEKWQPYRSYACLYLWQSLDNR